MDKTFLSIPHVYKFYIRHIDRNLFSILGIDNLSTYGIDKNISILGVSKLSLFDIEINVFVYLCIYNMYTYDIDKKNST